MAISRACITSLLFVVSLLLPVAAHAAACTPATYTSPDTESGWFAQLKSTMNGTENCELMLNTSETPTLRIVGNVGFGGPNIRGYAYLPGNVSNPLDNFRIDGVLIPDSTTEQAAALGNAYVVTAEYTHSNVKYSAQATLTFTATANVGTVTFSSASVTIQALPTVMAISPASGPLAGGTAVTITGTNFTGATSVTIGGAAATAVTVVNATTITATTPAGTAGVKDVVVTIPAGSGTGASLYTYGIPTVTAIAPASGDVAGGTAVTITGTDFTDATAVTIGGAAATAVAVVNATTITATTSTGTAGTRDVVVTTPLGTGTGSGLFTYTAPSVPAVIAISPATGDAVGGTAVTITGSNFTGATAVTIGGVAATGITVVDPNTITAVTPAGTAGAADVVVTTPGGAGTGAGLFTYTSPFADPTQDENVVGLVAAQAEISRHFLRQSTYAVMDRMEWLRRNRDRENLSNVSIRSEFVDAGLARILDQMSASNVAGQAGKPLLPDGWSVWVEGSVTRGKMDSSAGSSSKDIESHGVSIGLDREISKETIAGAALRVAKINVDLGSERSSVESDAYSLSLYGSHALAESRYLDAVIGLGHQDMHLTREHASGLLTGTRDAEQVFGSVAIRNEIDYEGLTLTPYGRIDASVTRLSAYRESGGIAALSYADQTLKNAMLSAGMLANLSIETSKGTLKPYGRLEYGADISPSSDADMAYVALPGTQYRLSVPKESTSNWRAGLGIDMEMGSSVILSAGYERYQAVESGHTDTVRIAAAYRADSGTRYSFTAGTSDAALQLGFGVATGAADDWNLSANLAGSKTGDATFEPSVRFEAVLRF